MNLHVLADWARTPLYLVLALVVLAAVLVTVIRLARRAPAAVTVASLGAMLATAYSSDTSWRFARDHLGMDSLTERCVMFAAAEVALFACALMARQNLRTLGAPGTPGVLVWLIVGVQVIPAYSESGIVAGTVRAVVGPVMSALLWHLAMGIELRHATGLDSQALPAVIARELRERLLARLGLSVRGRDAVQITRDRWTRIATVRAARLADLEDGDAKLWRIRRARRRLAAAVDRTDAGVLADQRAVLLERIGAYRHAASLASIDLASPWQTADDEILVERVPAPKPVPEVQPEPYPQLPSAVPEVVPAGAMLLPIVARPRREVYEFDHVTQRQVPLGTATVLGATQPRTRLEVHAEYTGPEPDHEPVDDSPPPPAEDTLTARARRDFLHDLVDGAAPSIRTLKERYGIGQKRATRIQTELKKGLAA